MGAKVSTGRESSAGTQRFWVGYFLAVAAGPLMPASAAVTFFSPQVGLRGVVGLKAANRAWAFS